MRVSLPLIILLFIFGWILGRVFKAESQEAKTPQQIAAGCDVRHGSVLASNIADKEVVNLPAGRALQDYELAYGEKGVPNALCVRTRPYDRGETAESHMVMFGDGTRRFTIAEHDLVKKVYQNDKSP